MMDRTAFYVVLWVVIGGGLVPALWFVWSWRPDRRWSGRQLDAGGWVLIIAALYLLAAIRAGFGQYRVPTNPGETIATFAIGFGIDAVLWLRLARWLSFRRNPTHPLRRETDPACDLDPSTD